MPSSLNVTNEFNLSFPMPSVRFFSEYGALSISVISYSCSLIFILFVCTVYILRETYLLVHSSSVPKLKGQCHQNCVEGCFKDVKLDLTSYDEKIVYKTFLMID